MKTKLEIGKSLVSCLLIFALLMCNPISSMAQSLTLESGSRVVLRINEKFNFSNRSDNGTLQAVVANDVYANDGTTVIIKGGTPATIDYDTDSNGAWGKAGKVCLSNASTRTVDNKKVNLSLSSCKKGGSKLGGVIILSVIFFPIGLLSGFMKGGMPSIKKGATFDAITTQDVACTPASN